MFRMILQMGIALFCLETSANMLCISSFVTQVRNSNLSTLINQYYQEKKYSPLPLSGEYPRELAEFIGSGEQVITVDVPTLPLLLSSRFNKVLVVDSSLAQLRFTNLLHKALSTSRFATFVANRERDFIEYNEENIINPEELRILFQSLYQPFMHTHFAPANIETKLDTISNITTHKKSTIFISNQISVNNETIYNWLDQGHIVVFSYNFDSNINTLNDIPRYCDIKTLYSQNNPRLIYIKITPVTPQKT